jgi:hypothetical protein
MAFPIVGDRTYQNSFRLTPPRPQPCQVWHGNRVTNAQHEEVGVSADGLASASPSWTPPLHRLRAPQILNQCGRKLVMHLIDAQRITYVIPEYRRYRYIYFENLKLCCS